MTHTVSVIWYDSYKWLIAVNPKMFMTQHSKGIGVESTEENSGPNFEKNRTAYLLVLSLELIALLSVCFITMARKILNKWIQKFYFANY